MKGGRISGRLPTKEAFAVHYPAYPSSLDRAVDTLGGAQAIAKTRSSDTNKLELRFRPEDPYSHPAFGDLHACNHFLLKISKKIVRKNPNAELTNGVLSSSSVDPAIIKQKATCSDLAGTTQPINEAVNENIILPKKIESQAPKEDEECLDAELVAHIQEAYHFNGMVDYQHVIAVHANASQQKKRNWTDFENGGFIDVDQEDLMILVPPLFSQKDKPEKVMLKPSASNSLKKKPAGVLPHHWEMAIEPSLALDFSIKEVPKIVNWEKHIPEDSEQWLWQKTVCELFEERPIWVKDSLSERLLDKGLEFGGNLLRRLLFRAAYYFANGPFLRFWIRKGYDPRKDPESRIYQRTDFRVPPSLQGYGDVNAMPGLKHRWEDMCAFRYFPIKYQTSFQLLELADDYIQQEIRKPPSLAECNRVTGWFPTHVLDRLRLCVAVRFLSIYPKDGAKPFLKDVSARFERSKLSHIFPKNVKVTEEVEQANTELPEEKEMDFNDNDDEEEDEEEDEEDDNIEEDLDVDQTGLQGRNFSPEAHSYTDQENMSRNYLQELFDSFPFDASGENGVLDTNNSDGEYQIYEQYSDGNCSDDDEL